ncbi:hypothetical protein B6I21_05025 [candidate division KSB1 bacterium 4572_119]|nr:MAG: hypothetical protein B6I21_05025 [candidate division KSB1 bacterium 4572_119]
MSNKKEKIMANQFKKFIIVINALNSFKVEYILIGGVAVILHGLERLTRDIDIFIKMTDENLKKLRKALFSVFDDPSIDEITFKELDKYPVIRYGSPDDFYIDIVGRLGESNVFENLKFDVIDYQGIKIRVATPETLYQLKKNTYRKKDEMDLLFLQDLINKISR